MLNSLKPSRQWSEIGLTTLVVSIVMTVVLAVADGIFRGIISAGIGPHPTMTILTTWVTDFRYLFEQGIYASTVFFVGAKFFETRSIISVGFDKLDAKKMAVKGPDDDNIVWIGRRYGTKAEAEIVAEVLAERLKESATA